MHEQNLGMTELVISFVARNLNFEISVLYFQFIQAIIFATQTNQPLGIHFLPKVFISCQTQWSREKITKHFKTWHSFEMEMRFKLKSGANKTRLRYKMDEKLMFPAYWTILKLPLGRVILIGLIS